MATTEINMRPMPLPAEPSGASKEMPIALSVRGLRAGYGAAPVLNGVNLEIREKTVTAIIGPSGCGKSTLIRCLNRIHEAIPGATCDGEILLGGRDDDAFYGLIGVGVVERFLKLGYRLVV